MSVHVDYVLMADKTDKLKNIKENINKKFNIQEYEKVKSLSECIMNGVVIRKVLMKKLPWRKVPRNW